jgi:hypothetical protein
VRVLPRYLKYQDELGPSGEEPSKDQVRFVVLRGAVTYRSGEDGSAMQLVRVSTIGFSPNHSLWRGSIEGRLILILGDLH